MLSEPRSTFVCISWASSFVWSTNPLETPTLIRLQHQPACSEMTSLEIGTRYPVIEESSIGPMHFRVLVGVYLEEQLPLQRSLQQFSRARIILIRHSMRDQLTLLAHIVLNSVRIPHQTIMYSSMIGFIGERRKQLLIFFLFSIRPIEVRYIQLGMRRQGDLA